MKVEAKNIISVKDYAKMKGVSVQAVYKKINRGSLPTIEIGGKKFIHDKS